MESGRREDRWIYILRPESENAMPAALPNGIEITSPISDAFAEILTPDALDFVAKLERSFRDQREELLQRRIERQAAIDEGQMPDFLPETAHIRESDWTIAPAPAPLQDR